MAPASVTQECLNRLRTADSPTVANVIELFGIRCRAAGYAGPRIRAVYPDLPPAVGFAVTAAFRGGSAEEAGAAYGDLPAMIEHSASTPAPRIAVFQDLDDPPRAATYGEVMATAFQSFGFAGLITSGAARDIAQVRRLGFPCWASATMASHGWARIEEIGVPVVVDGLRVRPGALLHADANGIVEIPLAIAGTVADLCGPFMEAEQITLRYLQQPHRTPEGLRSAVAEMRRAISDLTERARRMLPDG